MVADLGPGLGDRDRRMQLFLWCWVPILHEGKFACTLVSAATWRRDRVTNSKIHHGHSPYGDSTTHKCILRADPVTACPQSFSNYEAWAADSKIESPYWPLAASSLGAGG